MPRLSVLPTRLREQFGKRVLTREPEPHLVMNDSEQVQAYTLAGRIDGVMSASYLFHSARITQLLQGKQFVVDLGCGPATQLAQIAQLNPKMDFLGIDLSPDMLDQARTHAATLGLNNVKFQLADITNCASLKEGSADAVISTMALHHLPTLALLERCFGEIRRILKPEGLLYLADFARLKSLHSVQYFAYLNREHQPQLFSLDYERSLRAAFLPEDFERLTQDLLGPQFQVLTTQGIPILCLIKSRQEQALPNALKARLNGLRAALPAQYRRELDDMRFFFWLGGLKQDPFF